MPLKISINFSLTTAPTNRQAAVPHSGSWSEGFWTIPGSLDEHIDRWCTLRAAMLPRQAAIIGRRIQEYTVSGNRLIPGGSSGQKKLFSGNAGYECDVPQMALELFSRSSSTPNVSRFTLRGIPDAVVSFGEYQPTDAFKDSLTLFSNNIENFIHNFVGRNLVSPSARVVSIAGGVVTTSVNLAGVTNNVSYLRFTKVKDSLGRPVKGSFLVTAQTATTYTLQGLDPAIVVAGKGSVRVDLIDTYRMLKPTFGRITVKKIGRPSASYRGRASKRR
jgi:hypothetical protein